MNNRKSVYIVLFGDNAVFSFRDMPEKTRERYYIVGEDDYDIYHSEGSSFLKYKDAYNIKRRVDRWSNKEKARVIRILL